MAIMAPAKATADIVTRMNREIVALLKSPEPSIDAWKVFIDVAAPRPEELARFPAGRAALWTPVDRAVAARESIEEPSMRIAVLGGGHGCYAAAADLAEQGHEIRSVAPRRAGARAAGHARAIRLKDIQGERGVPIALATADYRRSHARRGAAARAAARHSRRSMWRARWRRT